MQKAKVTLICFSIRQPVIVDCFLCQASGGLIESQQHLSSSNGFSQFTHMIDSLRVLVQSLWKFIIKHLLCVSEFLL